MERKDNFIHILRIKIQDFTTDKSGHKVILLEIKANSLEINKKTKAIILDTLDTTSADISYYKPTARSVTETLEDLEDEEEYIITALARHKYRGDYKYVFKIKANKPEAEPAIYKSSFYMEQILNKLNIHGEGIPFLTFKTDTTRTTPNKHKAKYMF